MATFIQIVDNFIYTPSSENKLTFTTPLGKTIFSWIDDSVDFSTVITSTQERYRLVLNIEHLECMPLTSWHMEERGVSRPVIETSPEARALGKIKVSHSNFSTVTISCVASEKYSRAPQYFISPLSPPVNVTIGKKNVPTPRWAPYGLTTPPFDLQFVLLNE